MRAVSFKRLLDGPITKARHAFECRIEEGSETRFLFGGETRVKILEMEESPASLAKASEALWDLHLICHERVEPFSEDPSKLIDCGIEGLVPVESAGSDHLSALQELIRTERRVPRHEWGRLTGCA